MNFWDFIKLAIFLMAIVVLLPLFFAFVDWYLDRRARKERTKWRQMQDEHAEIHIYEEGK